jgi:putative copper export protein
MDIAFHFLHLIAAIVWVGGQVFLGLVMAPVLRRAMPVKDRLPISLAIAQRFKRVSHTALAVLLLTGLWSIRYVFFAGIDSFFFTSYGRIFAVKMILLALFLVLGVLHDVLWGPALTRLADRSDSVEFHNAARRMAFWARFNVGVALAIVLCSALLRHTSF